MSIKKRLHNLIKDFIRAYIGENLSNLENAGKEVADDYTEGIVDQIDYQFSVLKADKEIKKKIVKKAKINGLSKFRNGIDNRMQENIEECKKKD